MQAHDHRHPLRFAAAALLAAALLATPALAADAWIHVTVDDPSDAQVELHLPISLMEAALPAIPLDVEGDVHISLDDENEWTWHELRELWQAVKDAPDATYVTIRDHHEELDMRVRKEGGYLLVESEPNPYGAEIDVRLPAAVIDALFSGPERTMNLRAALDALVAEGPGHLVRIRDGEEEVKVWIDYQAAD